MAKLIDSSQEVSFQSQQSLDSRPVSALPHQISCYGKMATAAHTRHSERTECLL